MDTLKNKRLRNSGYLSRYNSVPYYYDTLSERDVYGLGGTINKNIPFVSHKVNPTDTLDTLALKYYNNPTYWWIIAYFNDIPDAMMKLFPRYKVLQIPNISAVSFVKELR